MKPDRVPGMGVLPSDQRRRLTESDRRDASSLQIQEDALAFNEQLSRPPAQDDDEDASPESHASSQQTPFDLISTLSSVSEAGQAVVPDDPLTQIVLETVQALYVSDDHACNRQVSMVLGDSVLPGVTLSVYEDEGRIVSDFTCVSERSREWLYQFAERLVTELVRQLSRDARIYVRTGDADDLYPFQMDASTSFEATGSTLRDGASTDLGQGKP